MSFSEWWVSLFVLCGTVGELEVFLFGKQQEGPKHSALDSGAHYRLTFSAAYRSQRRHHGRKECF